MEERVFARYMSDLEYFINLFESKPTEKYHLPVALAYLKLSKYEECATVCVEGLKRFPSHCPTKTILAEAYINIGKVAEAKELLHDVVAEDDGNYKALKLLGTVMQAEDLSDRAVRYLRLAYFKAPEDHGLMNLISKLGGEIDFGKILDEQSKHVGKREEEIDEDTKTYNEINQSIKNAEIMMQDLFDNNIDLTEASNIHLDETLLDNLIAQTIQKTEDKKNSSGIGIIFEQPEAIKPPEILIKEDKKEHRAEPDPLAAELEEILLADAKEEEARADESTRDLIKELSNIGFAEVPESDTIPTDMKGVGIDSKTGDVVVDLYNVADETAVDEIVVKEDIANNITDDIVAPLIESNYPELETLEAVGIDDTDKIIDEVDRLVEETNSSVVSQLDLEFEQEPEKSVDTADRDNNNLDEITEDFFEPGLASSSSSDKESLSGSGDSSEQNADDEISDMSEQPGIQQSMNFEPIMEEISKIKHDEELIQQERYTVAEKTDKPAETYPISEEFTAIEKYYESLIGEERFFNINEIDLEVKELGENASFHQSQIFDEILEKSNLTVNDMLSKSGKNVSELKKKTITKLEKKLEKIRKRRG